MESWDGEFLSSKSERSDLLEKHKILKSEVVLWNSKLPVQ